MKHALTKLLHATSQAVGAPVVLLHADGEHRWTTVAYNSDSGGEATSAYTPSEGDVSVPVLYNGRDFGRLIAVNAGVSFNRYLLEGFASAAGYVIGHAQEIDESAQALAESAMLRQVGEMLVTPSGLNDSLALMLRAVRQLFNADYATIATVEGDGRTHWRVMDGHRSEKYKEVVLSPGRGIAARVIAAGKPITLEGIGISPHLPADEFPVQVAEGGISVMAAPLFREGRAVGAVVVGSRTERTWKESELAPLSVVANAAALAIEQARASASESAQRNFLGKIVENFPGGVIVLEPPDWRVLLLNSNFTSMLPEPYRSGEPVIGRAVWEIVSQWSAQNDELVALMEQVVNTGEAISYEQLARQDPQRGTTYANWSIVPVEGVGEGGKPVVMLISYDVTDTVLARENARRAADRARARAEELDAIINQMADGVSLFDADGRVIRINPAGQRLLGRNVAVDADPGDYPRLYGFHTLEGDPVTQEQLTFRRALQGETVVGEQLLVRRPSGEEVIISVSGSPLTGSEGEISGAVLVFHDITHEKMTERLKDEFLAVVSHELRTPLSAIMGYSHLMLRGLHGTLNERQTRALNAVRANADRLLRLINDLLDVSKLESGVSLAETTPVNLASVVARTIAQTRVLAVTAGVTIHNNILKDGLPPVLADEPKLHQVIENLLSNALKFTPQGGAVSFSASPSAYRADDPAVMELDPVPAPGPSEKAASMVVTVTDTGAGLEQEQITRIWDRFYQVDSSAKRRSGGTGLGLAIVRSLVELHGGRAWAKSQGPNMGSVFSFTLPVAPVEAAPAAVAIARRATTSQQPEGQEDGRMTVLIVEDDEDQREIICDMLELEGYNVVVAADGEEALRLALEVKPAAVALDVVLPGRDGWEVLNRLKREPSTRDIPVLIISVVDQQDFGKALGADEYMVKPLDATTLRTVVRRLLGTGDTPDE